MNDLAISDIDRQNALNNRFVVDEIQKQLDISGLLFDGKYRYTKQMVADFYGVGVRTINRYLKSHSEELSYNGYILCCGKQLSDFKLQYGRDINIPTKTTRLGLFDFRSFLDIGMLLVESERARQLRGVILDLVIITINQRTGGGTKYINRRDINFLPIAVLEENYRKNLTSAIGKYTDGHPTYKYEQITDFIYKAVFKENAKEYRELLRLGSNDSVRQTLYSEVLLVISSFENGLGDAIQKKYEETHLKLLLDEVENIVKNLAEQPILAPILYDARTKMASRDLSFRDVYHGNIADYLRAVSPEEFERFIGDQSIDFDHILEDNKDVLKRLKQVDDERGN